MSAPEHNRQPAGQPTGGQFAPTSGTDAGLDLATPAVTFEVNTDGSVTVPPGEYFVGDPGYALSEQDWDLNFHRDDPAHQPLPRDNGNLLSTTGGGHALGLRTAYGDGAYQTMDGTRGEFPVDSGTLGLTPANATDFSDYAEGDKGLGRMVTLSSPTKVWSGDYGDIHIGGDLVIYTGDLCNDCATPLTPDNRSSDGFSLCATCQEYRDEDEEREEDEAQERDWS